MYLPDHFKLTDMDAIRGMLDAAPLATLICQTGDGLRADHIPLMMTKTKLVGHIAAANDLHRIIADGHDMMAVFRATDAYISPNWYPSKGDSHQVVPTWNYEIAHVHGKITFHHDRKAKLGAVGLLTKMMETRTNGADAWRMSDAPADYLDGMLGKIVAFEILIDRVEAKAKLSQNKPTADRMGAADGLADHPLAQKMRDAT